MDGGDRGVRGVLCFAPSDAAIAGVRHHPWMESPPCEAPLISDFDPSMPGTPFFILGEPYRMQEALGRVEVCAWMGMPPSSFASVSPSVSWVLLHLCSGVVEEPRFHNVGLWMMCSGIIPRDMLVYGVPSLRSLAPWCTGSVVALLSSLMSILSCRIRDVPCAHTAQQQLCPPLPCSLMFAWRCRGEAGGCWR